MPERAKLDSDSKVVHLEPESQRIVRAKLARLPAPVTAAHESGKTLFMGLLKAFFDRADDSLFELADRAQSNQEQNLYFDSMREVRVQRRGIEKRFADAIDGAFANLISKEAENSEEQKRNFTSDALSLVDHDELEEMVALDASIARANQEYGEAIQLISLRLDSLVPVKVYQKNNPLGPDVLCSTFMDETKKLDVGIKAKLVLFKLFDKAVVAKLASVYDPINQLFKDHNVLPSLSGPKAHQSRRSSDRGDRNVRVGFGPGAAGEEHGQLSAAQEANLSPEVLSALKNMLGDRVIANPSAPSNTQIAASELVNILSRVQHMPSIMNSRVAINVRSLLNQLERQKGVKAPIGQVDDQVMNLVSMLFDFILEDRNLAPPMKALISRMQIPIIKVAVADKTFFTKGGHVARRLLNEMATAAMGWTGDENATRKDPLYAKIESIVRKLIEEFETDLQVFTDLLADFTGFLEKEKKRASVLERRTIDAEDGKAKAEVARTTVAIEVELRTHGVELPKVVAHLINEAWKNVLFVTALKYGYEADEWKQQLKVLEHLVWSVQPPTSLEHRQKLIKLVPVLLKKLRSGLDTISYNPFEMSDLFKSLEKVHIACIRGKSRATAEANQENANASAEDAKAEAAANETSAELEAAENTQPRKSMPDVPEPSLSDLARRVEMAEIDDVDRILDSVSAGSAEDQRHQSEASDMLADDPHMKQVNAFVQGAWFDMRDAKGENIRCRLAAFIKPTGKYIFVNRNGMKVAEKTQLELALALKADGIHALDNSMLFDRALETVVSSLRKN